ncbi:hypothetical protein PsYK624_016210 [Phanerochaete sordida]|uniref:Uncharacterized protein n=1 Tax=Phanerochaete sordida TaxID=48140 RepID=A0A9P3L9B2_9APHY|nr:hypothetical protein PsYK624_016210 [Phanerochaete sordida]
MDSDLGERRGPRIPVRIAKSPERWLKKLRRWKSMPTSQLAPSDRPLFECQRCAAVNVYGALCTWCGHACDAIVNTPAARRRVSAPQLLSDAQKEQLRLIEKNAAIIRALISSQAGPTAETPPVKRHRNRDAAIYTLDATTGMVRTNGKAKVFMRSSIVTAVEAASTPCSPVSMSSDGKAEAMATPSPSPSPRRTLRRRKRISITPRRSSRSLRTRSSKGTLAMPSRPDSSDVRAATPDSVRTGHTTALHPSPSPRSVTSARLGSPARPLYTAIRKRTDSDAFSLSSLRSASPFCQPAPERPTSITSSCALAESDEDELDIKDLLPMAPSRSHFRASSGCSLSGETELRMALSRKRSNTVGGPTPEYVYRDREQHKEFASIMQTMKKISQGMKSLVKSRDG